MVAGTAMADGELGDGRALQGSGATLAENAWAGMMNNWSALERAKPGLIDLRLQQSGLPDVLRGPVWLALGQVASVRKGREESFATLLRRECVPPEDAIARDIRRTFSRHLFFADRSGQGQKELFQVLRAYAALDPGLGYCQGMGFVAAVMLCYLPAESAFWLLVAVMQRPRFDMQQLFRPGMPQFRPMMERLSVMLERTVPSVHGHFQQLGMDPGMYASQWFMTLFAYNFPLAFVTRVWDLFLARGWPIVFRVALALLHAEQHVLVRLTFEQAMIRLRDIPKHVRVEEIVALALQLDAGENE